MLVSGQAGPLQGPVALDQAFAAASRDPRGPRRQPTPCTASPAAAAHRDRRHNTEGGLDRADPCADEQAASDDRPPPSLPEPPPLPAKPTKPSKWWMLLLIIPAIATGLAVVASQFHPARLADRRARTGQAAVRVGVMRSAMVVDPLVLFIPVIDIAQCAFNATRISGFSTCLCGLRRIRLCCISAFHRRAICPHWERRCCWAVASDGLDKFGLLALYSDPVKGGPKKLRICSSDKPMFRAFSRASLSTSTGSAPARISSWRCASVFFPSIIEKNSLLSRSSVWGSWSSGLIDIVVEDLCLFCVVREARSPYLAASSCFSHSNTGSFGHGEMNACHDSRRSNPGTLNASDAARHWRSPLPPETIDGLRAS